MLHGFAQNVKEATVDAARKSATDVVRKSALMLVGSVLLGVGIAFLTVAAWIAIASMSSSLTAALIIAFVYVGAGLILFAVSLNSQSRAAERAAEARSEAAARRDAMSQPLTGGGQPSALPPLVDAFIFGLTAAMRARSDTRRPPGDGY